MLLSRTKRILLSPLINSRFQPNHRIDERRLSLSSKLPSSIPDLFDKEPFYVQGLATLLDQSHLALGLPYSTSIIGLTILTRSLFVSPLFIISNLHQAKMSNALLTCLKNISLEKIKKLHKNDKIDFNKLYYQAVSELMENPVQFFKDNNVNPFKERAYVWVRFPIWLFFSLAIRGVCDLPIDQLSHLAKPLDNYILPSLLFCTNVANYEINSVKKKRPPYLKELDSIDGWELSDKEAFITENMNREIQADRLIAYASSGLMLYISTIVPKALVFFWCTSAIHQLVMNILINSNKVKEVFGIPPIDDDGPSPYKRLFATARVVYTPLRWWDGRHQNQAPPPIFNKPDN